MTVPEGDTVHRAAGRLRALVGQRLAVEAVHPRARATGVAERLDGRCLEAVEAHGKNLLLRFEGDRVLRSHLGMSGSWRTMAPDAPVRGDAVARADGRACEGRAARRSSARDVGAPRLGARAGHPRARARRRRDRHESPADRPAAGDRRGAARPARGRGHREHLAQRSALARAHLPVAAARPTSTTPSCTRSSSEAARLMAESRDGGRPRREVYRRAGRPCRRCGEPMHSAKQGDAARTVYWCPACQRGERRGVSNLG